MRKISITEALTELKLYDAKIKKAKSALHLVCAKKKSDAKILNMTVDEFIDSAKAGYQSIVDMMDNKDNIRKAITQSNAVTEVEIAGKKYTVAEAIAKKNNIADRLDLLAEMEEQWADATEIFTKENKRVDLQIDRMIEAFLGKDSDKKVNSTDISVISDSYREKNEWQIIDPIKLHDKIQALSKEIDEFMAEVDVRLSISNSITYIEV